MKRETTIQINYLLKILSNRTRSFYFNFLINAIIFFLSIKSIASSMNYTTIGPNCRIHLYIF